MSTITESELLKTMSEPHADHNAHDAFVSQVDDGSSSSLSEPDDRTGNEDGDDAQDAEEDVSDDFDTEAETERIEETPQKQRNVLLTMSNAVFPNGKDFVVGEEQREGSAMEEDPQQSSDTTLEETGDEDEVPQSNSAFRKRKRADYDLKKSASRHVERHVTAIASKPSETPSPGESIDSPTPLGEDENQQLETGAMHSELDQSRTRRKRKGRKIGEEGTLSKGEQVPQPKLAEETADHSEAPSSNGDDVEMEENVERDPAEAESTLKTEEDLAKKRTAMEALSAIENCFATLRDKLFDERLAQCNDELAMLEQPIFIHPELRLMKEVIDRRRDQKIKYEQTLLKYRLESLQRESIANKAQMHSQYMQTVGELRDTYLSQINAEIYQTQRERRSCEADIPDFMYAFATKRSKQITEQTAYNEEVSLLSGIAKYVGFPAAPDVLKARSNEWEEDERTFRRNQAVEDEANKTRRGSQNRPSMTPANLSGASTFGRPPPAAEVQFFQQNAWANPQHPVHRRGSALSQAAMSTGTPPPRKRLIEPHGSASTIPEQPSAPNSSVAPTSATQNFRTDVQSDLDTSILPTNKDTTPSRNIGDPMEEALTPSARPAEPSSRAVQQAGETSYSTTIKKTGRESNTPTALPKPLPFMQNGETLRASPPIRNSIIKGEDSSNVYRHTPISHHSQGSPPINAASNG